MPLTNAELEKIKKSGVPGKYFDGNGLYVELTKSGAAYWRLKYRFAGKENRLSMGVFPAIGLKAAREARESARKLLANGIDPSQARKIEKITKHVTSANTFEAIALEWHQTKSSGWSISHADTTIERLKRDLLPWLGSRPLSDLKPPEILVTLRRIENRGTIETARRCRGYVSQIFNFAIATGRADTNPAIALGAALQTTIGGVHPAIVEPVRFGAMLRNIDTYAGSYVTRAAMQIHALTCQRPNEVSGMAWTEIDLAAAWWIIPATRMKGTKKRKARNNPHYVPLSTQAIAVLKDLQPLTGRGTLVFPGERKGRCISENTARMGIRSMGYTDHTPHGFRASIRTMAREHLRYDKEVIERFLSHGSDEELGGAYDRTQYFADRIRLVQDWADYLDKLRIGANIIQLDFGKAGKAA
jgi:integrase